MGLPTPSSSSSSRDSPYLRAKQVQLKENDPSRAIPLFLSAIDAGDRVEHALKDLAFVLEKLKRPDEAIEAIKSFRHLCPYDSQESIDNVLVELYKRAGKIEEAIEMLQSKLKQTEETMSTSQGEDVHITTKEEKSRLLGNLAWAYQQQNNYINVEEHYKKALSLDPDPNKQCNLPIWSMQINSLTETKPVLQAVKTSSGNKLMEQSYAKSLGCAHQILNELDQQSLGNRRSTKEALEFHPSTPCRWIRVEYPAGSIVEFQEDSRLIFGTDNRLDCLDSTELWCTPSAPSLVDKEQEQMEKKEMEDLKEAHYKSDKKLNAYEMFSCGAFSFYVAINTFILNFKSNPSILCTADTIGDAVLILVSLTVAALTIFIVYQNKIIKLNMVRQKRLASFMDLWMKLLKNHTCPLACLPYLGNSKWVPWILLGFYSLSLSMFSVMMVIIMISTCLHHHS